MIKNINIRKEFGVEKDQLLYEAISEVNKLLKDRPDFVAITPVGSRYRGYAKESSDIDLLVLFDSRYGVKLKNNSQIVVNNENVIPRHIFLKGKEIEIHPFNINLDYIKNNFNEDFLPFLARCFQGIFSVSNSKKIAHYRKEIKKIFFDKIPENKRKDFINKLANQIAQTEIYSGQKMKERKFGLDIKKQEEKIKNFWERRLNYFLYKLLNGVE